MLWLSWQPKLMHWHKSSLMPLKKLNLIKSKISVIKVNPKWVMDRHTSLMVVFYSIITYYIIYKIYLAGFIIKKKNKLIPTIKFKPIRLCCLKKPVQGLCSPWPGPCSAAALPVWFRWCPLPPSLPQHCGKMSIHSFWKVLFRNVHWAKLDQLLVLATTELHVLQNHNEKWTWFTLFYVTFTKLHVLSIKKNHMGLPDNSSKKDF